MSPTVYVTSVCVCLKSFTARRLWCVCVCVSMGRWWEASSGPWERLPWWRLLVSVMLPWQQWPQQGTGLQGSLKPICPAHTHTFIECVTVRMSFAILVFDLLLRCFTTRCSETHTHTQCPLQSYVYISTDYRPFYEVKHHYYHSSYI